MKPGTLLWVGVGLLGVLMVTGAQSHAACEYNGKSYRETGLTCQAGHQYACEDGSWIEIGAPCSDESQGITTYEDNCLCDANDLDKCNNLEKRCNASKETGLCVKGCVN